MYSGGKRTLLIFAAVLMSGSVVLSLSRGGLIAVIAEFAFLLVFCMRSKYRHTSTGLVVGAILLVLLFLSLFDTSVIFERVATLGHVADEGVAGDRLMIARDGLKMFALHPVTGWGLGAFPAIYPHFRSFYTNLFVNQAHNDWLQLLVETGIVGMLLTIWFLFLVYRRGFKNARRWYREPRAALNLAALAAITGLLVHSFSDFNLHIPANAALFFVMCGLVFSGPDDQEE
jgi:O-antigen ligase